MQNKRWDVIPPLFYEIEESQYSTATQENIWNKTIIPIAVNRRESVTTYGTYIQLIYYSKVNSKYCQGLYNLRYLAITWIVCHYKLIVHTALVSFENNVNNFPVGTAKVCEFFSNKLRLDVGFVFTPYSYSSVIGFLLLLVRTMECNVRPVKKNCTTHEPVPNLNGVQPAKRLYNLV